MKCKKKNFSFFCNFVKKKPGNLWLKDGHFITLSGHFFVNYINVFQKTEIQMVNLRCLVGLNLNWIKSYGIISVQVIFFHAWKCIISGLFWKSEIWHLLHCKCFVCWKHRRLSVNKIQRQLTVIFTDWNL